MLHVNDLEQCLVHNKCGVNTTIVVVPIKLAMHGLPLQIDHIPFSALFRAVGGCSCGMSPQGARVSGFLLAAAHGDTAGDRRPERESC